MNIYILTKTTCVTSYGAYDLKIMPFNLTNALTTFYTLINCIFQLYLNQFVVVYLDEIVVYNKTLKEHAKHL